MRTIPAAPMLFTALGLLLAVAPGYAAESQYSVLAKGKYLVDAGDCVACHTEDRNKPFAGGRAVPTPFGTIYSANITPDRDSGIGAWSKDDFYRAMHEGRDPHGDRLYPAFPYPYFTKMPRDDVDAVFAYLKTLRPVVNTPPRNTLTFPLDNRGLMAGWNFMFFKAGEFTPDGNKSAEWNRGAYLVEGPGHCGACHTAKNLLGGDKTSEALQGAPIQGWTAPKLVGDDRNGLGRWSREDIAEYLKTGRNKYSGAAGLMAEVVVNSTSKLNDGDLLAIATYLKDMPKTNEAAAAAPEQQVMTVGKAIYDDTCAACHQTSGEGVPHMFPPLKGDAVAQQSDASSVMRVILDGAMTATTKQRPTPSAMPAFDWKLNDDQIAAVATYVRNAWGNSAPAVTAGGVKDMRNAIEKSKATSQTIGYGDKMNAQEHR